MSKQDFQPDFSPPDYDKLNQPLTGIQKKKSGFEFYLYELQALTNVCRIIDNCDDQDERGYVVILHDIMAEKLGKFETLVGQL